MDKIVVIDGEIDLTNVIDGELDLTDVIDGSTYEVLKVDEGTRDYEKLIHHPSIEDVVLIKNKTFEELGLSKISGEEIIAILSD